MSPKPSLLRCALAFLRIRPLPEKPYVVAAPATVRGPLSVRRASVSPPPTIAPAPRPRASITPAPTAGRTERRIDDDARDVVVPNLVSVYSDYRAPVVLQEDEEQRRIRSGGGGVFGGGGATSEWGSPAERSEPEVCRVVPPAPAPHYSSSPSSAYEPSHGYSESPAPDCSPPADSPSSSID